MAAKLSHKISVSLLLLVISVISIAARAQEISRIPTLDELSRSNSAAPIAAYRLPPPAALGLYNLDPNYAGPTISAAPSISGFTNSSQEYETGDPSLNIAKDMVLDRFVFEPASDFAKNVIVESGGSELEGGVMSTILGWSMKFGISGELAASDVLGTAVGFVGVASEYSSPLFALFMPVSTAPPEYDNAPPYAGMQYGSDGQYIPINTATPPPSLPPPSEPPSQPPTQPPSCDPADPCCDDPGGVACYCQQFPDECEPCDCDDPDCDCLLIKKGLLHKSRGARLHHSAIPHK